MIIEVIFNLIKTLLTTVLGLLPNVPQLPDSFSTSISNVITVIFDNLDLISIFVRVSTIKILVPLIIVVVNFEHIYHFVMWIVKKIPLSID